MTDCKALFMSMVQTMALGALGSGSSSSAEFRTLALQVVATVASEAIANIPAGMSLGTAARELVTAYMPEFAEARAAEHYHRPEWLPALELNELGETEELVDGHWRPVNPQWEGLPGDRSVELNIMAALRDQPAQLCSELALTVGLSEHCVRRNLRAMKGKGCVEDIGLPARWSLAWAVVLDLMRLPRTKLSSIDPATAPTARQSDRIGRRPVGRKASRQRSSRNDNRRARPLSKEIENAVREALQTSPALRCHELAAAISVSEPSARKYLRELELRGVVDKDCRRPMRWSLTAAAKAER